MTHRAHTFYRYQSAEFAVQLAEALDARPPDLVHMDSMDLHIWLSHIPHVPVTCTHHDIESHALSRRAGQVKSAFLRWYIRRQANLVARLEADLCPHFGLNLVMSELDAQRLSSLAPSARIAVVPNGVDIDYYQPPTGIESTPDRVIFIGPTYFFPNADAVEYLTRDIWPLIRSARPSASLELVGWMSEEDRTDYSGQEGVTAAGHVPDIRPHVAQSACSIVPIRVGGGTRLKILDAWAMGSAVVSTSVGCEGLAAVDGENILIRDTAEGLADAVIEVLSDPELRSRLGANSRKTVETDYSWDVVGRDLRSAYRQLLSEVGGPR